ncbi:hypothetical protein ASPZODRAFT_72042 [Penicilliopsis zonata CBS 506.65]|uniref:F-box domain-containing protein n=1 Tax=Penicilliopsis zonata CBS 506.65 TaxID=1073090 RepID=A0A1L9SB12_9EURO|nr:hypothetical protein ASPZODRAFT_72042 [Penicilliopsis zonata CBS 506.65]OJJ44363.1 hypothetical protein ASPZODRAFT_72042 [Penicilliopsis zonata CBS 506.65]
MTEQKGRLDTLPFDVLYQIVLSLDDQDYNNLSWVNKNLNVQLRNEYLAKKIIDRYVLHTKEGKQAVRGKITYRQALSHSHCIKEAFATGQPYLATILGHGTDFLYNAGVLCYLRSDTEIRVLNVHESGETEQVINLERVMARITRDPTTPRLETTLLYYNEGGLSILVKNIMTRTKYMVLLDVQPNVKTGRLRFWSSVHANERTWARHNRTFLWWGAYHEYYHDEDYNQWAIGCAHLETGRPITCDPMPLPYFYSAGEVGQNICFEMHGNDLFVVSNLVELQAKKLQRTSCYSWTCLSPAHLLGQSKICRYYAWRRHHEEGPINDTWTDLSLETDEATGRMLIIEGRSEWRNGGSVQCRTYYQHALPFPEEICSSDGNKGKGKGKETGASALSEEAFSNTEPRIRLPRHCHSEYDVIDDMSQRRDFILARTKHHSYNLSSSSFVDLVNDLETVPNSMHPRDCLRLRIASRKRKRPVDEDGEEGRPGMLYCRETDEESGVPIQFSDERFVSRGVQLWPPTSAPAELKRLLCPNGDTRDVRACADERSIIYSINDSTVDPRCNQPKQLKRLVLLSFDPHIRFPNMKPLQLHTNQQPSTPASPSSFSSSFSSTSSSTTTTSTSTDYSSQMTGPWLSNLYPERQPSKSLRQEPAMHMYIRDGFRFPR